MSHWQYEIFVDNITIKIKKKFSRRSLFALFFHRAKTVFVPNVVLGAWYASDMHYQQCDRPTNSRIVHTFLNVMINDRCNSIRLRTTMQFLLIYTLRSIECFISYNAVVIRNFRHQSTIIMDSLAMIMVCQKKFWTHPRRIFPPKEDG